MVFFRRFLRDDKGSATIEFILWVPVIVALLVLVIDATTIFITHAEMWNVARDTARRMAKGDLTEAEAEAYAAGAISLRDLPYTVEADHDTTNDVVQVIIRLSLADTTIIGGWMWSGPLTIIGGDMVARVVMRALPDIGGSATTS